MKKILLTLAAITFAQISFAAKAPSTPAAPAPLTPPALNSGTYLMSVGACSLNIAQSPDKQSVTVSIFGTPGNTVGNCLYGDSSAGGPNDYEPMNLGTLTLSNSQICGSYPCYSGNATIYVVDANTVSINLDPSADTRELASREVPSVPAGQASSN